MRRVGLLAVIGAAGVSALVSQAAARPPPFAGILASPYGNATRVGCFDALSLRPTSAPVVVGEYRDAWSASPDGTRVALGMSAPGREGRIGVQIVDLARVAVEREVETGIAAGAVAWIAERKLVAALLFGGIVLIDPVTGAIVRRWPGWVGLDAAATRTRRRFVMLEPGRRSSRLAAVDRRGRLRSVSLSLGVRRHLGRRDRPALVADPVGEHAYVLAGGRTVFDVDLRRMRVRRHQLPRAKPAEVREREGIWLGGGRLAISGLDYVAGVGGNPSIVPAGLSTVDTGSWKMHRVDAKATGAALAPGRLLAYGRRGLRAYTLDGRRVFAALREKEVWSVGGTRGRAYAGTPAATYVIDMRSGRVMRRIPRSREVSVIARRCPTGSG